MTFAEILAEVIGITKRPDLQDRTMSAIRAATLKMHQSDFFYKDLVEVPVQFTEAAYIQNFLPTDILPYFRKAKYIRFWQGDVDGQPGPFLTPIQVENSNDSYGYIKTDVFYMAGQLLQIRTCDPCYRVLFGAYVNPVIAPIESYSSWIANEYPYAIIYEAVRTIFRSIGFTEQANEYAGLAGEVLAEIKLSCIDDIPVT